MIPQTMTIDMAKGMAKTLRAKLAADGQEMSHSACLEIVAAQLGFRDWNAAAAVLDAEVKPAIERLKLPDGWTVSGTDASDYHVGLEAETGEATIRSIEPGTKTAGFATLMQSVEGQSFRGKRMRLKADLRSANAAGAVTLWFRVDNEARSSIRFDNMETRKADGVLIGTQGWTEREIVLDVPKEAFSLHYGFYLRGSGQGWARNFDLSEVGADVPVTTDQGSLLKSPVNMNLAAG